MLASSSRRNKLALLGAGVVGHTVLALLIIRGLSSGVPLQLSLVLLVPPALALLTAGVELVRSIREAAAAESPTLMERRLG